MISHDRAEELISARLDAPLLAADRQALQAHLATCSSCRAFAAQTDALARGLHALPTLAPSPVVSRGVMTAIASETSGWAWLRRSMQLLSSPGLAVASSLALIFALAATLLITVNAPRQSGTGSEPEGTIAAVAVAPLPTERPTEPPPPTVAPTATTPPQRTVKPARTEQPAKSPTPRPTATSVPIEQVAAPVTNQQPPIETGAAPVEQPPIEPAAGDATLAMAPTDAASDTASTDMAQEAAKEQPANEERGKGGGRKASSDAGSQDAAPPAADAAPMTEPVQVPEQAIDAMKDAGTSPDAYLPPAPLAPAPPQQAFLPITPTPVNDGTPTPEYDPESGVPQLAEDSSGDLGVAALAPDAPSSTTIDNGAVKSREKHDKSAKDGKSSEQRQAAFTAEPMGWSMAPVLLMQTVDDPDGTGTTPADTTGTTTAPTDTSTAPTASTVAPADPTGETIAPAATTGETTASEQPLQIDPATGLAIDPRTGLLIDPRTGYLLDPATGLIFDPRTGYQVHPMTGLLIDPITGAQLDPVTLAVVIPPGFGSDQPAYVPGSPSMHSDIENVVDNTYDNATIQIVPPTDGPVQPVDEIIIPTEAGDAVEISGGSDQP